MRHRINKPSQPPKSSQVQNLYRPESQAGAFNGNKFSFAWDLQIFVVSNDTKYFHGQLESKIFPRTVGKKETFGSLGIIYRILG